MEKQEDFLKDLLEKKKGFYVETSNSEVTLSLISLKIGLGAYFSTYSSFKSNLSRLEESNSDEDEDVRNYNNQYIRYNELYNAEYTKCIFYLHHFVELACKSFLIDEHPLLLWAFTDEKKIRKKYIDSGKIEEVDTRYKDDYTVGYDNAIDRLVKFIDGKILKDYEQLQFIVEYQHMLKKLGKLRDKVWHQGSYVLHYDDLDKFIGSYVFPFIILITNHQKYIIRSRRWKYNELYCGIDPMIEIINHFKEGSYNRKKVAFLKELGNAAYKDYFTFWKSEYKQSNTFIADYYENHINVLIERKARRSISEYEEVKILVCPVCGLNSLLVYEDSGYETDENGELDTESYYREGLNVKCEYCSFELDIEIKNASEYGIKGISDFWV